MSALPDMSHETGGADTAQDDEHVVLGCLTSPYGVKGWLKVYSYTSPIEGIFEHAEWVLSKRGERRACKLSQGRPHGKGLVASLEGISSRELAEQWAGADILLPKQALPALAPGDYYWYQLEGLQVETLDGECLGQVNYLFETGANDVLVIRPSEASLDERERLLPFLPDDVIRQVDLDAGRMIVDWDPEF